MVVCNVMVSHVTHNTMTDENSKTRKKSKGSNMISCEISCLDGSILKAEVEKGAQGEVLFNKVINDLSVHEKECVGLRYTNDKGEHLD